MSKVKLCSLCLGILLVLPSLALAAAGTKPTITGVSPTSATAGSAALVLTVTGSNFTSAAVVLWNGSALNTTHVGSTQLQATIPAPALASAGSAVITVYAPGRNGGTSNGVGFTIGAAATGATLQQQGTPLAISTTSIPIGTTGTAYSSTLAATGGTAPYTWSVTSGALPPGLSISTAGAISGTPTTSGSYSFVASIKDSASSTLSYTYSTSIGQGAASSMSVSTASLPGGTAGTVYPSTTLAATGGTAPYTWSVASGSTLPAGLSLSTAGALSGTPATAKTYSFSIQATDSASNTATKAYSVTVAAAAPSGNLSSYCLNNTYGPCGDPYEGSTFSATGKTAIGSTCPGTLVSNTGYYLTQNIGSDPTASCIVVKNGNTLDLRGYTVTGRIDSTYIVDGTVVFNGIVACSFPDGTTYGCIRLYNDHPLTAVARVHHMVIDNAADPGAGSVRSLHVEDAAGATLGAGYKVDHVAITVESALSASRAIGVNVTTRDPLEVSFNNLTCSVNANACNGVQVINGGSVAVQSLIHDNNVALNTAASLPQTARGIGLYGPDSGSYGPSGFQVYSNLCTANTNRCFRARQVTGATFSGNTVYNCQDRDAGCYHFADPDVGGTVNPSNIVVQNEAIEMNGGVGFYVRNGSGITIMNLTLTGTAGRLAYVTYASSIGVPTQAEFCNVTGASSLGTGSGADPSTTVNILNAGNWGPGLSGPGTINTASTCP